MHTNTRRINLSEHCGEYTYIYIYTYTHTHIHTYIHRYTYTYTHKHWEVRKGRKGGKSYLSDAETSKSCRFLFLLKAVTIVFLPNPQWSDFNFR